MPGGESMAGLNGNSLSRFLSGFWAGVPDPVDSDQAVVGPLCRRQRAGVRGAYPSSWSNGVGGLPAGFGTCARCRGCISSRLLGVSQKSRLDPQIGVGGRLALWSRVSRRLRGEKRAKRRRRTSEMDAIRSRGFGGARVRPGASLRRPILDQELSRLPEAYRAVLVLCYLEGKTNEAAARQLGLHQGYGFEQDFAPPHLLRRLTRRGLALSAGVAVGLFGVGTASAAVSEG